MPQLPKDPRTLLGSVSRDSFDVKTVSGGSYYYFGLGQNISKLLEDNACDINASENISLQLNIDGVPLFKSTGGQY